MTDAERLAKLDAYRDALEITRHHAHICTEADSLQMDISDTLRKRIAELEAVAPADDGTVKGKRRGRN